MLWAMGALPLALKFWLLEDCHGDCRGRKKSIFDG